MGKYGVDTTLEAELIAELDVDIGPRQIVGQTREGYLRVIPITGGTVRGQAINGAVLSGGADWNTIVDGGPDEPDRLRHVFAKYTIQTSGGDYISVENEGWKSTSTEKLTRIATHPKFTTSVPELDWLNYGTYVGELISRGDGTGVKLRFYRMK